MDIITPITDDAKRRKHHNFTTNCYDSVKVVFPSVILIADKWINRSNFVP